MVHRILLIEDEEDWIDRVRLLLAPLRCRVTGDGPSLTAVRTEGEGEVLIQEGGWSLIICDLYLPPEGDEVDWVGTTEAGLRLVEQAHRWRTETQCACPILVLTQFSADQELDNQARENGADEVIAKVDRHELKDHLSRLLNLAEPEPLAEPDPGEETPREFRRQLMWRLPLLGGAALVRVQ